MDNRKFANIFQNDCGFDPIDSNERERENIWMIEVNEQSKVYVTEIDVFD